MPSVSRWMIKTSFVYLVLAFLIGLLQGLQAVGVVRLPGGLGPVYIHLLVVGWLSLLIFGVVYWMFPKFSKESPRGRAWLGWATYGLINLGLALRVIGETWGAPGTAFGWLLVVSAGLQWLGGAAFVANTWPRVKEK